MSSSSSCTSASKRNPKIVKVDLQGNVYCHHDLIAVSRIAGHRSSRNGDEFYGCRLWPNEDCKMFMWRKDFDVFLKEYGSRRDQEIKEMQIENLKLKNMVLEEENKNLKLQLSLKRSNWKSNVVLGLAIVVIAIVGRVMLF